MRKTHRLTPEKLDVVAVDLARQAIVLAPAPAPPAPEPGDQHLWELLAAREVLVLITGDRRLQRDRAVDRRILSPATFVERWLSSRS